MDANTLLRLELNGDLLDSSGAARHPVSISATPAFAATPFGSGLVIADDSSARGFDWSLHVGELSVPYTVELVFQAQSNNWYQKLWGANDGSDSGWYLRDSSVRCYPNSSISTGLAETARVYLALVVRSASAVDVYANGVFRGTTSPCFTSPPAAALFLRDDSISSRDEQMNGLVDAVRISRGARSVTDIDAVRARLGL